MNRDEEQETLSEQEYAFISDFQSFVSALTPETKEMVRKGRTYEGYYIRLIQISGLAPPILADAIETFKNTNANTKSTKSPVNRRKTSQ